VTAKSLGGVCRLPPHAAPKSWTAVPGGLGGTFAGNPLSCAAALAVLDYSKKKIC